MWRGPLATVLTALALPAHASAAALPYDFDGDGTQDLATGIPLWSDSGAFQGGAVVVQRGGPKGLTASAQVIHRATPGIPGDPRANEFFGNSLASGDFNGDGFADLAVASGYALGPHTANGVTLIPGSESGIDPSSASIWEDPAATVVPAIAAADVDRDGHSDLAANSLPRDPAGGSDPTILVVRGSPQGLRRFPRQRLAGDGAVMRFGDLDRDRRADLVFTNSSYIATAPVPEIGVCRGKPGGLEDCASASSGTVGFHDLAIADVTGGKAPEVILGAPSDGRAGAVRIYTLGPGGLRYSFRFGQATPGVPGNTQQEDSFGRAVDAGRFGSDRKAAIFIGAAGENARGRVTVVRGAKRRMARRGNSIVSPSKPGVPGGDSSWAGFGASLALLDHDGDGRLDLDVGAYGNQSAGNVTTIYGAPRGLTTEGARLFDFPALSLEQRLNYTYGRIMGRP
jgi:hypothetical protein